MRVDGRTASQLRPVQIFPGYLKTAEGSALITMGNTHVLCAASIEQGVPPFLRNSGKGWVTAEYSMLPRATSTRSPREVTKGRASGRTHEIQRLIGRSLRSVVNFEALGERSIIVDCDVIQADGGTRVASITGAYVALALAVKQMLTYKMIKASPLVGAVAAISVGILKGEAILDLCYEEDSRAEVDANIVMTDTGRLVEFQATAEQKSFDDEQMDKMRALARIGNAELIVLQKERNRDLVKIYCATGNPGKLREFRLAGELLGIDIEPVPALKSIEAPEETGATFEENARIKALYYSRFAPGLVFADDSALEVDALNGAPGVYSARFAGPDADDQANNNLLLERLANELHRSARFVCVIALAQEGVVRQTFRGTVEGEILREPHGHAGFGYDPLFFYPPYNQSFGQVDDAKKFAVSHRGNALRELLRYLV